ncbi:S9 family peptidase [Paraburkholderia acidisoli]|uniref:Prolyl oligopeptidase family serine peptidase n=1 Tax=Paraburkholderia acidisoli TaxID=2571748 RepID=A0A7Z2JII5_9BURK|nr:S9 family peptidase [Paraburkholderia acidisoli]QGZ65228.1 prolyl oligopeptidase family serine peptidase [Paraburkholderia acidisoli]
MSEAASNATSHIAPNPALIPRAQLFGNPEKALPSISPDGRHLAWLAPVDGVLNIWVAPAGAPGQAAPVTRDTKRGIHSYSWTFAGPHLLYPRDADGNERYHIHCVNVTTGVERDLTPFEGIFAAVYARSHLVRDRVLIAMNRRDPKYFDLYALFIESGELQLIEQNTNMASFIVDERFNVRVATRLDADGTLQLFERDGHHDVDVDVDKASAAPWKPWFSFAPEDARVSHPLFLNRDGTALFLSDSRARDTAALVRLDLATGERRVLAEDARCDLGGVIVDKDTREPIGYGSYYTQHAWHALTPGFQTDLDRFAQHGLSEWHMVSRTEDDSVWVIIGKSALAPGKAYLYRRDTGALELLFDTRPDLAHAPLVPMQPVTIRARDGLELVSYLTRPAQAEGAGPLVLLVHGGPWGRDGFGFHPEHQWLANRGYSVLSVNFRASTGFGKRFVTAGDLEWGRRMDDDLLDAVEWAVREGIADPGRVAIVGTSYGGYAVLAGMTRNPQRYACGIDVVGPSNLETLLATVPSWWESMRAQLVNAMGNPATEAGLALLRERSPVHQANRIARPLLIAQGANDPRVRQDESDQMVAAMKHNGIPVTYLLYPDEGHGFARPVNRFSYYAVAEAFLARYLGGRAEPMTAAERQASSMQVVEAGDMHELA